MTLAIVAYPSLDETDRHWIESFRAKHDPQSPRIDVHFTMVFPAASPDSDAAERLAGERRAQARRVRGSVSKVDMVNVGTHKVQTIASYALGPLHDRA